MAAFTWFGMIGVIVIGTAFFGWWTRPSAIPTAIRVG
jgi:hypothetical protein